MSTTLEFLPALATFAFVSCITPGPNNLMLLGTGARFGVRRGMPTLLGVLLGFQVLLLAGYVGVAAAIAWHPGARTALAWACGAYLAWLAWRSWRASAPDVDARADARPPGWMQAALLQVVNPKAWGMSFTGATLVAASPASPAAGAVGLLAVFAVIGLPCNFTWMAGGAALRPWLADAGRRRRFDVAMSALLLGTAAWLVASLDGGVTAV